MRTLTREIRVAARSVRYDLRNKRGSMRLLATVVLLVGATALIIVTGLIGRLTGDTPGAAADPEHSGQPAGLAEQYLNPQGSAGFPYLGSPAPPTPSPAASSPSTAPTRVPGPPEASDEPSSPTPSATPSPSPTGSDSGSPSPSPKPTTPLPSAPAN